MTSDPRPLCSSCIKKNDGSTEATLRFGQCYYCLSNGQWVTDVTNVVFSPQSPLYASPRSHE